MHATMTNLDHHRAQKQHIISNTNFLSIKLAYCLKLVLAQALKDTKLTVQIKSKSLNQPTENERSKIQNKIDGTYSVPNDCCLKSTVLRTKFSFSQVCQWDFVILFPVVSLIETVKILKIIYSEFSSNTLDTSFSILHN